MANKVRNVSIRPEAQVLIYPDLAGDISGANKRRFYDAPLLTQDDIDSVSYTHLRAHET